MTSEKEKKKVCNDPVLTRFCILTTMCEFVLNSTDCLIPRISECLHSTHNTQTRMTTFHTYPNVRILRIPECAFHTYPYVCIPRIPECLHYTHNTHTRMSSYHTRTRMFAFHTNPNVCILRIPECSHFTRTRMSAFHTCPDVCTPRIPECLHSTRT